MDREFFDNAFDKAKSAFETAYKKTGDVLSVEKLRFNISTLKTKQNKLYAKLGKDYFESVINETEINADSTSIINDIVEINNKISDLTDEINYVKSNRICPKCGAPTGENSIFCATCGERITFDTKDEEDE